MLVVELLFALLLNQVLVTWVAQNDVSLEEEKVLFEYFGTFPRSMLSMFQVIVQKAAAFDDFLRIARKRSKTASSVPFLTKQIRRKLQGAFPDLLLLFG